MTSARFLAREGIIPFVTTLRSALEHNKPMNFGGKATEA
jgi:hypothetical protein